MSAANFLVQRWRYRIDRLAASIDRLCEEVNQAAGLATRYWLAHQQQDQEPNISIVTWEAELIGFELRLQQIFIVLEESDKDLDMSPPKADLVTFFDAITGGNFRVRNRAADYGRAQAVQAAAAMLNGSLRRSLAKRSKSLL